MTPAMLDIHDHNRDSAGMTYVYPVLSRRAGGVSIGINLNVNNACNWACIYCQVPGLTRGGPPLVDLARLETELRDFLRNAISGDFLDRNAPAGYRQLVDLAFSGNGEPTSAREFPDAVEIAGQVLKAFDLLDRLKLRVISNGSLMRQARVQRGIARVGELGGEVWFKIDRGTAEGIRRINGIHTTPDKIRQAVSTCSQRAPTWIQTCLFRIDDAPPDPAEFDAYLDLIAAIKKQIEGVHLYGLARSSRQPEATRLSAQSAESLSLFAQSIASLGVRVITNQ
ncbi:MAG: radical SAM protein [Candidatus Accumulibacter sp.]|jgi:wyosine [tRNA(Phe)-imidazoG37] synthetase (radical SAM superfamily)|nr:radical SAM protein [Accumulibacter sp.]